MVLKYLGLAPGAALTWAASREFVGQKVDALAAGRLVVRGWPMVIAAGNYPLNGGYFFTAGKRIKPGAVE
ncbi:hypothetical protein [Neomoorella humiferrea]|uniref:hypothetical protein n=1 Tax=Neomoorella humiferrea TaxID=676965 RepID=UPI0030CF2B32